MLDSTKILGAASLLRLILEIGKLFKIIGIALMMLVAFSVVESALAEAQTKDYLCDGRYKGGGTPSEADLLTILQQHQNWLRAREDNAFTDAPGRANLCDAILNKATFALTNLKFIVLNGAHLEGTSSLAGANLEGAELVGAHLHGAHLDDTNLTGATLRGADLTGVSGDAALNNADLRDANLTGAYMQEVKLRGALLQGATLVRATLTEAELQGAELTGADLTNAILYNAYLEGANLQKAIFRTTNLEFAQLDGADLTDAHLEGADLTSADLERAILVGTFLDKTMFTSANLAAAIFEPDLDSLPNPSMLADAHNLYEIRFRQSPTALVRLRAGFKDLGLYIQEREITPALRRSEMLRVDSLGVHRHVALERAFNYLAFDLTCQYGRAPHLPLLIVAVGGMVFSFLYIAAQLVPGQRGGIWVVWDEKRIDRDEGKPTPERLIRGFPPNGTRSRIRLALSVIGLAVYFSLLSAARIGWHELNVGTWITRIQPREYSLHATGWVRCVSGVQSLLSVYLVALAVLTYFGTPFE